MVTSYSVFNFPGTARLELFSISQEVSISETITEVKNVSLMGGCWMYGSLVAGAADIQRVKDNYM